MPGLQRLLHRPPVHHAGSDGFDGARFRGDHRTLAVDGLAQRVYHPAHHGFAHRNRHDLSGAPDFVAFPNFLVFAQQHGSHLVLFQVERDAGDAVRKLHHLAGHDAVQAVNTGDSVAHRDHRSGFGYVDRLFVMLNFAAQHARDFISLDLSHI